MLSTCQSWHRAITAEAPRLWETMVHKRFPSVAKILTMIRPTAAPFDFKHIYREQHAASLHGQHYNPDSFGSMPPLRCTLKDFVFTVTVTTRDATLFLSEDEGASVDIKDDGNVSFRGDDRIVQWTNGTHAKGRAVIASVDPTIHEVTLGDGSKFGPARPIQPAQEFSWTGIFDESAMIEIPIMAPSSAADLLEKAVSVHVQVTRYLEPDAYGWNRLSAGLYRL